MTLETLTTARLTLRPAQLDDAQAIFDHYAADPEVTRYCSGGPSRASRAYARSCSSA